jgi:CelD/BcsL family acetyltransferase involved in cellulose biosynthesis
LGLIKYKCLRVIGDIQSGSEYPDIIIRSGFEDKAMLVVMEKLLEYAHKWDCIFIARIAGWTGARDRIKYACEKFGLFVHERDRTFATVKLPQTYDNYLKQLSRNRRAQIRRKTRRFKELHNFEINCCRSPESVPQFLSSLFELHKKRWESVGQAGSFVRRPPMKRFYESFAPQALKKGWLRLWTLKIDNVDKAVQFGYSYNDLFSQLQEGYEPNGFDGIGNVLREQVFQECIKEECKEYDFLGEFTEHKRRWGAISRTGYDLFIGRKSLKNRILFWKRIWPTGRYIREGRPANEGYSHG